MGNSNTSTGVEAYPLAWPMGRKRTPGHRRERAPYKSGGSRLTMAQAIDRSTRELRLLGATHVVISSNVELRRDGLPYSGRREPDDPGVAVYFTLAGGQRCLWSDGWDRTADNLAAVAKWVEGQRQQLRCKVGDVEAAFAGFKALPGPDAATPMPEPAMSVERAAKVLCRRCSSAPWELVVESVNAAAYPYKRSAMILHPDRNGGEQSAEWNELQAAKAVIDRHHAGKGATT